MQPLSPEDQNNPQEHVIQLSPRHWLVLRLVFACLFGLVITYVCLAAGYSRSSHSNSVSSQLKTQDMIKEMMVDVEQYRQNNHALPRKLDQFGAWGGIDAWGRPLIYTIQGTHYLIVSRGEDGKPGGTGWNADISSTNLYPAGSELTYHQFLTGPDTRESVQTACITGGLAVLLCLVTVRSRPTTRRNLSWLIVRISAVFLGTVCIGEFMTLLELPIAGPPSGH